MNSLSEITIRPIQPADNADLALIVRNTLAEFGAANPGTVYFDPTTDALFELFQTKNAAYFIAEKDGKILGGGGIYPTEGLPPDTCELVKMYLLPEARGIGLGRTLIEKCLETAKINGFRQVYLETLDELHLALKIYAKFGFEYLSAPLGDSKHFGCGLWMLKKL
ncbi:MAG: GNAT family N-acetyltransferase [Bacteroidetes bacterium GWB2_41_8]|nr:MAG: GNAT family N-acetyltransferase [Bacteroidetes bacterium GWB2_41_8]